MKIKLTFENQDEIWKLINLRRWFHFRWVLTTASVLNDKCKTNFPGALFITEPPNRHQIRMWLIVLVYRHLWPSLYIIQPIFSLDLYSSFWWFHAAVHQTRHSQLMELKDLQRLSYKILKIISTKRTVFKFNKCSI